MRCRLAALSLALIASTARAGVIIELVPNPPPIASLSDENHWVYDGVHNLDVAVFARLDANGPAQVQVRSMQFDASDTDRYEVGLYPDHAHGFNRFVFWDFSSVPVCQSNSDRCGYLHDIDSSFTTDNIVRIEYTYWAPHPQIQLTLHRDHAVRVGLLEVVLGVFDDEYVLDFLNSNDWRSSAGARVEYDFPVTGEFSAYNGTISGGRVLITQIPEPATLAMLFVGLFALAQRRAKRIG